MIDDNRVVITPDDAPDLLERLREVVAVVEPHTTIYVSPGAYRSSGPLAEIGELPEHVDLHVDCADIRLV